MKLYYPKSHYQPERMHVFPLLRPFIKGEKFTDEERIALYGVSERDFKFTDTIEDADLAVLTMAWNYYINTSQTKTAIEFVEACAKLGKKVLTVNSGDFGVKIPYYENLIVLRYGGYKSRFSKDEFALPPFINDPLIPFLQQENILERSYNSKPVIGFCGHANASKLKATKEILTTAFRNSKYYLGFSSHEPQQLISTTALRASVLRNLQKSPAIHSNFIVRKKYRAGVRTEKNVHKTTYEFYNNINESDYVLCVRGAGNFSIRFYETLALGRIPVLINTDCALPFDDALDWKKHVVWVEYEDRLKVAEKVIDFHRALSEKDFLNLQLSNRELWEERLTLKRFFTHFLKTLK